jgi:hypothetical protein
MPTNATVAIADVGSTPGLKTGPTFCHEYAKLALDLAGWAKYFLVAALVLGIVYGLVEVIKRYQAAPPQPKAAPSALKDLIDSLKAFLEALSNAPAWLALFGVGLLLFWGVGAAVPDGCQNSFNDTAEVGTPASGQ